MTREEFKDGIQDWEALFTFCEDNDLEDSINGTNGIISLEEVYYDIREMLDDADLGGLVNYVSHISDVVDTDCYCITRNINNENGILENLHSGDFEKWKNKIEEEYEEVIGFDGDD